jgi:hypothetical protein
MNYVLIENETGKKYVTPFVDADYPASMKASMKGQKITREQAQQLIDTWNRAQANHKREVSYQLEATQ